MTSQCTILALGGNAFVQRGEPITMAGQFAFAESLFEITTVSEKYPHVRSVLPACGYSSEQLHDLQQTIERSAPEVVIDASPAGLERLITFPCPVARVRYSFEQTGGAPIGERVLSLLKNHERGT